MSDPRLTTADIRRSMRALNEDEARYNRKHYGITRLLDDIEARIEREKRLRDHITHMVQTVHQAHQSEAHLTWYECGCGLCNDTRNVLAKTEETS